MCVHRQRYNLPVAASIEEFSYQLTAEALREQERAVAALRTRAGTVLAAASVSGSFLGTKVSHGSLDVWAVLALIAFVLCVGAAIYVLLPHKLMFAFRARPCSRRAITRASTMSRGLPRRGHLDRADAGVEPRQDRRSFRLVQHQLRASDRRSHPLDGQPGRVSYVRGLDES